MTHRAEQYGIESHTRPALDAMADVPASHSRHHNAAGRSYQDVSLSDSSRAHLGDVVNINNYSGPNGQSEDDKRWKGLQQALTFHGMDVRRRNIEPAYGDTCRWVLETAEYCRWRNEDLWSEHHGFLWIKGNPGVGKSTIMKFLLEHAQAHFSGNVILSFFFNARGGSLETSTEGLYRSLLLQLLSRVPSLRLDLAIPDLDVPGTQWPVKATQDLFREALILLGQTPVTVLIDALDEGDQKEVRAMVAYLGKLASHGRLPCISVNVCFASRHYPRITLRFCEELIVDGQPSHNDDIREYVAQNLVADLTVKRLDLERQVVSKAQGVFLWVVLVIGMLNESFDQGASASQLENTLGTMPEDLDGLFSDILRKGASDAYLLPALQSVIARADSQMFGFIELYFMILIGAGELTSPVWDHEQADVVMMKRFILHSTKGLVEIATHGVVQRVQFIHESVRQHLLEGGLTKLYALPEGSVEAHCHAMLANCCQEYIRLIDHTQMSTEHLAQHVDTVPGVRPEMDLPLLNYAQQYTFWHVEHAHAAGAYELESLHNFPLAIWIKIDRCLRGRYSRVRPSASLLYVLIETECFSLATEVLQHYKICLKSDPIGAVGVKTKDNQLINAFVGPDLNSRQGSRDGQTMLMEAAEQGHNMTVQLLLESGADVNSVTEDGISALSLAIFFSHIDVVRLLLDSGAEIDNEYGYLGCPLVSAVAATSNNVAMVKLLLEHGADVNVMDDSRGTALEVATRKWSLGGMKLLLLHGADPNIVSNTSGRRGTALMLAVAKWDVEKMKLLLLHGADPNIVKDTSDGYDTALMIAAARGDVKMTKLLLLHGADVDLLTRGENISARCSSMRRFALSCRETGGPNEVDQLRKG